jgi:pheromone shutdown-related protein TraB
VSKASVELVADVIAQNRPETVCVELCPSRYQAMRQPEAWQNMDLVKAFKEKKAFLILANLILAAFQKRMASRLEVKPGQEMVQAVASAESIGAAVHLADRDVRVTLTRAWRAMGWWQRLKLLVELLFSLTETEKLDEAQVEALKQQDVLDSLISQVGKSLPAIRTVIIDERDRYLTQRIRTAPGTRIVAVVGAGHVPGIKNHWNQTIDIDALDALPPAGRFSFLGKYLVPVFLMALLGAGFAAGGVKTGAHMLSWWLLASSLLAGLGALMAMAHPLTMIATGWVSGLVEAMSRKPKVRDFEQLPEDIASLRGFWRNNITRILLVVILTNLGAAAGTFLAIPMMVRAF